MRKENHVFHKMLLPYKVHLKCNLNPLEMHDASISHHNRGYKLLICVFVRLYLRDILMKKSFTEYCYLVASKLARGSTMIIRD